MTRSVRLPLALLVCATALVACGGGDKAADDAVTGTVDAAGSGQAQTATVDMTDDLTFVPNVVRAQVGTLVLTATNGGRVPHNLVFDDSRLGATSTVKGKGTATLTVRLATPGTYRFTCTFHSGMNGRVVVSG